MTVAGLREQRRQRLLEVNREHLLDAAEEEFGARGYRNATIREIAERAEFSVGAVYGLVDGKEDLLAQTLSRRAVGLLSAMGALAADSVRGIAALHRLADLQIDFFRAHPHFGRLWLRQAGPARWGLSTATLDRVGADLDRAMAMEADLIRGGQAAGEIRAGDPEVLAHIFSAIVQAFQATDPASVGEATGERFRRSELHALIEGAFAA